MAKVAPLSNQNPGFIQKNTGRYIICDLISSAISERIDGVTLTRVDSCNKRKIFEKSVVFLSANSPEEFKKQEETRSSLIDDITDAIKVEKAKIDSSVTFFLVHNAQNDLNGKVTFHASIHSPSQ